METSWLATISISHFWGSDDSEEALQLRAAHTPTWAAEARTRTSLSGTLPGPRQKHGEWWPLPLWPPAPSPHPCVGTPLPVLRAPHGGRGGGGILGLEGWRRCQFPCRPRGDPVPVPPGFLHKGAHQGASLTGQSDLQAPADRQAGGRMRGRECACLRVSLSVCDRGRAELRASACAGASVCRSVREALSPALLACSLPNRPTKCA